MSTTATTPASKPVSPLRRAYLADLERLRIQHGAAVVGVPLVRRGPRKGSR